MKRFLLLILFYLAFQFSYGQACGIYRIEYVGSVTATGKEIVKVYLPTTMFLHRVEEEKSERAFIEAASVNGLFNIEIGSHLTTPYNDIDQLRSYYKKRSKKFKMKVAYRENNLLREKVIGIGWDEIEISIVEDGKFGTLFRFALKDIAI
ncbi:MAG: hypothetical protein DI539_21795 [Flavobacterium psychrophilum]|nr:MAG: hypothetical protein DI539_21795 [Flavobacterium psychrophilum]